MKTLLAMFLASLAVAASAEAATGTPDYPVKMQILRLSDGVRFGIIGERQPRPAPTVFLLAHDLETMQREPHYTHAGMLLLSYGFISVTLDCPGMGEDRRPGEPPGMAGAILVWRHRLEAHEDIITPFVKHARLALDYMVEHGYTDSTRVGAVGISRGGLLSAYLSAADSRVRVVAGLSPLIDFLSLKEFKGVSDPDYVSKFSLYHLAPQLVGRAIWLGVGDTDLRVDTDRVIAFGRALVGASLRGKKEQHPIVPIELVIGPSDAPGGVGHHEVQQGDALVANWILKQFGFPPAVPLTESN